MEKGRQKPSTDAIIKLAKYFGVSTDYLLTGEELYIKCRKCGEKVKENV